MTTSSEFSHDLRDLSTLTSYKAGILQARTHRTLRKMADESLKGEQLTSMQWFLIGAVHDKGDDGIQISDLGALLGTNVPFVTNAVSELESRKIVTKTPHERDSRIKLVRIHPRFAPRIPAIESLVRQNLRETVYAKISPMELLAYINTLQKFSDND